MDFSEILTGLATAGAVAAIVGAGALKAAPGFARWATNKVATFFR
ncbi:capsid protein [Xanthomonas sp. XNM01]|nr:capsid protein [Xanthomonas sp. XNM01]MBD9368371.1 capsid protein [Xanthomonas sp. XNM01]